MNEKEYTITICGDASDGGQILAIAYVPVQNADFGSLYAPEDALCAGTVFPSLDLPFLGMGGEK